MRTMHIAATLAILLSSLAAATAQMPGPTYIFSQVTGPTAAQQPGSTAQFNFTAERSCTFAGDYLPSTTARVDFVADTANITVAGPGQVQFPEQFCAQQSRVMVSFQATVAVLPDAEAKVHKLAARLSPEANAATVRYSQPASTEFLLTVEPKSQVQGDLPLDAKASPGAAAPLFMVALLGMALLIRRRSSP